MPKVEKYFSSRAEVDAARQRLEKAEQEWERRREEDSKFRSGLSVEGSKNTPPSEAYIRARREHEAARKELAKLEETNIG